MDNRACVNSNQERTRAYSIYFYFQKFEKLQLEMSFARNHEKHIAELKKEAVKLAAEIKLIQQAQKPSQASSHLIQYIRKTSVDPIMADDNPWWRHVVV
mmetsp:Transcript_6681/g.9256  ORF Transcript_6681/g.9256 Transcript_6681/m.9256 type:complete len:99 (-) Transcript_6681:598-894(-)